MAQKVVLIDDLDGSEGVETIRYTVDGQEYEIDLSEKNSTEFRTVLRTYMDKSRKVEAPPAAIVGRRGGRRSTPAGSRTDSAQIREWATARGIEVNPRGRIKKEISDQYYAELSSQRSQTPSVPASSTTRNGQEPASEQPASGTAEA